MAYEPWEEMDHVVLKFNEAIDYFKISADNWTGLSFQSLLITISSMKRVALNKSKKISCHSLWVTYLIITLAFMQLVPLHMHVYDHKHGAHHHESLIDEHAHVNQVHLSHESSDANHSHEVISEMDIEWEGLFKHFSFTSLAVFILIVAIIVFPASPLYVRILWRRNKDTSVISPCRAFFLPSLRAPPG